MRLVFPAFLQSKLYVVMVGVSSDKYEFFLSKSPNPENHCITVSEDIDLLSSVPWPKQLMTGRELLMQLPKNIEIVITYSDGGDYITKNHLNWLRENLSNYELD